MFRRLGYFVTESSEHFAEYVPWFIKRDRPDLIERFDIPLDEYPRRCEIQIAGWERPARPDRGPRRDRSTSRRASSTARRSSTAWRPASRASSTATCRTTGLIDNLPDGCCVEVPCLVDHNGVQPTRIGRSRPSSPR